MRIRFEAGNHNGCIRTWMIPATSKDRLNKAGKENIQGK